MPSFSKPMATDIESDASMSAGKKRDMASKYPPVRDGQMPSLKNIQRSCGTIQVIASVETYAYINQ